MARSRPKTKKAPARRRKAAGGRRPKTSKKAQKSPKSKKKAAARKKPARRASPPRRTKTKRAKPAAAKRKKGAAAARKKGRRSVSSRRPRGAASPEISPPLDPRGMGPEAGGQSGDTEGLSRAEVVDSESVEELLEEGQAFEAGIIEGVENAREPDEGEVRTRQVPEDDVPQEYLDED